MSKLDPNAYFAELDQRSNSPLNQRSVEKANRQKIPQLDQTTQDKLSILEAIAAQKKRSEDFGFGDSVAGFGQGAGALTEGVGTLYGLATGDMDNAVRKLGQDTSQYYQDRKSVDTLVDEQGRTAKVEAADGELAKAGTAFWETVKNPNLLRQLVSEQVPMLVPGAAVGRVVGGVSAAAGTAASLGTTSAIHGADPAGESYDNLMKLPDEIWQQNPEFNELAEEIGTEEAKQQLSLESARAAGALAAGLSLATQKLIPGGARLDEALAGTFKGSGAGSIAAGFVKGAVAESVQEGLEEGSGKFAGNLAESGFNPEKSLSEGVGEATGLGAAGSMGFGGLGGAATAARDESRDKRKVAANKKLQQQAFNTAKETGNVDELTDPAKPDTYNPAAAVDALNQRAQNEALTEDERTKASTDAEAVVTGLKDQLAAFDEGTEAQATLEKETKVLAKARELQKTDNNPAIAELIAETEEAIKTILEPAVVKEQAQKAQIEAQLASINEQVGQQTKEARPKTEEVETLAERVQNTEDPADQKTASDDLVKLAMADPDAIPDTTVEQLANSEVVSPELKTYFSKVSAARNAVKTVTEVSQNIMTGAPGFKGLNEYQGNVSRALGNNSPETAKREIDELGAFEASQTQKKAALERLQTEHASDPSKELYLVKDDSEAGYSIVSEAPWNNRTEQGQLGGLTMEAGKKGENSIAKLLRQVDPELEAIAATKAQLEAAIELAENGVTEAPATVESELETPEPVAEQAANEPITEPVPAEQATAPAAEAAEEPVAAQAVENENPVSTMLEKIASGQPFASFTAGERSQLQSLPRAVLQSVRDGNTTVEDAVQQIEAANQPVEPEVNESPELSDEEAAFFSDLDSVEETDGTNIENEYLNSLEEDGSPELSVDEEPAALLSEEGEATVTEEIEYEPPGYIEQLNGTENTLQRNITIEAVTRPLAMVKDFTNFIVNGGFQMLNELVGQNPSEADLQLFNAFLAFVNDPALSSDGVNNFDRIKKNFLEGKKRPDFAFDELTQLFNNGDLDANIVTAIAHAGLSHLMLHSRVRLNTDAEINRMLGRNDTDELSETERASYRSGLRRNQVARSMGQSITKALGFKFDRNMRESEREQITVALGGQALAFMLQIGALVEREVVTPISLGQTRTERMIEPARDENGEVAPYFQNLATLNAQTGSFLDVLFTKEATVRKPATEKNSYDENQSINRSSRAVPPKQAAAVKKYSNYEWTVKEAGKRLRSWFAPSNIKLMMGYDNRPQLHVENQAAVASKNQTIDKSWEDMTQWEQEAVELELDGFMLPGRVWSQQRIGEEGNYITPQGDKYHRQAIAMKGWSTTFDKSDEKMVNLFKRAVALAIDIDTDKMSNASALQAFEDALNAEGSPVRAAIELIKKGEALPEGAQLDEADQAAFVEIIQSLGTDYHAADAIQQYALFELAETSFTTDIMAEVDGVTNGPALGSVLLGALQVGLGGMFGFFSTGSPFKSFNQYKEAGFDDAYQSVSRRMMKLVGEDPKTSRTKVRALSYFLGDLEDPNGAVSNAARKLVKNPITISIFGSSVATAIDDMGKAVIEKYYAKLEDAASYPGLTDQQRVDAVNRIRVQMNTLLTADTRIPDFNSVQEALNYTLDGEQPQKVLNSFKYTLGNKFSEAFETDFGQFIENRRLLNEVAQASWTRYNEAFKYLVDLRTTAEMDRGTLDFVESQEGIRTPLRSLSPQVLAKIRKELAPLVPVVHTALSSTDPDATLAHGLDVEKSFFEAASEDVAYQQRIRLGSTVPNPGNPKKPASQMNLAGSRRVSQDPGVRAVIMLIHSMDAAIATNTFAENEVLNIHDAVAGGLGNIDKAATDLNRNTMDLLIEYSLPKAIAEMGKRSLENGDALAKRYPALAPVLDSAIIAEGRDTEKLAREALTGFDRVANIMEMNKLLFLADLESVNQYGWEDGVYTVTEEDKGRITAKIAQLEAAVQEVAGVPRELGQPADRASEETLPVHQDLELQRYWQGDLTYRDRPYHKITKFLQRNEKTTFRQLRPMLQEAISKHVGGADQRKYYYALLEEMSTFLDPNLTITTAPLDGELGQYGFSKNAGEELIESIFLSTEKGTNVQTMMHELVHAATAHTIYVSENRPGDLSKAKVKAVNNMRELQARAKAFVEADPALQAKYGNAVSNVYELVAYGMTNHGFQAEVLANLDTSDIDSKYGRLRRGIVKFYDYMTSILFGENVPQFANTGLGLLMNSTPLLFARGSKLYRVADTATPSNFGMATRSPHTFTSAQVFDALGDDPLSPPSADLAYRKQLREVLRTVVDTVYQGNPAIKQEADAMAPVTAEDVFLQATVAGIPPFASSMVALGSNNQESYVAESVERIAQEAFDSKILSAGMRNQIADLYEQAAKDIDPNDLPPGAYQFIFDARDNPREHLSRFIAASLAYEPLVKVLQNLQVAPDSRTYAEQPTVFAKVNLFFERMINLLDRMLSKTYNQPNFQVAVGSLAQQLATLEAKNKAMLARKANGTKSVIDHLELTTEQATNKIREGILAASQSDTFRKGKGSLVAGAAAGVSIIVGNRTGSVLESIQKIRNELYEAKLGVVAQVANEFRGISDKTRAMFDLLNLGNMVEQAVKQAKVDVAKRVTDSFSRKLTKAESAAVANLVRADASALLNDFTIDDLTNMVVDYRELNQNIADFEAKLASEAKDLDVDQHLEGFVARGKDLGQFMTHNKASLDNPVLNVNNILRLFGTSKSGQVNQKTADALAPTLDTLVSLYGLKYMSQANKTELARVLRDEQNRPGEGLNGVEYTLRQYKLLQDDALKEEFKGQKTQMIKGYTRDTVNPYIEMKIATEAEAETLIAAGYTRLSNELPQDAIDPDNTPRYMYVIRGRGLTETVTGVFGSLTKTSKGATLRDRADLSTRAGQQALKRDIQVAKRKATANADQQQSLPADWTPAKATGTKMVPVFDGNGNITDYRYIAEAQTRDLVLERNNDVGNVLGQLAGHALNKQESPALNNKGVKLMHEMYKAEYSTNPNAFLKVGKNSTDPELRERYQTLPPETKKAIRDTWGGDDMWVRNDIYSVAFGFRKASIGDMFAKDPDSRKLIEKIVVNTLEMIPGVGKKAALRAVQAENGWQEVVRFVKDVWVIRNVITLLGNEISNASLLLIRGVSPVKIISDKVQAWRNLNRYTTARLKRDGLQTELDFNQLSPAVAASHQNEIAKLNAAMEANPVKDLVDASMYKTIVEDLSGDQDSNPYSYQSKLSSWTESKTRWIPESIKKGSNELLFLGHDTVGYKFLNKATIMSDFAARYTLVNHLTTRKNKPMSNEQAREIAQAGFVNYDIPTHKGLQYLNDMGILPFTKYYIRIQAAIFDAIQSNPGRALMVSLMGDLLDIQTIADSSVLTGDLLPGRLSAGALEAPGAIGEIAPIKFLTSG